MLEVTGVYSLKMAAASECIDAKSVISALREKGIKLLALDFDKTIIDIHTGGAWRGPSTKLFDHVRPCMKALLEAALVQQGLDVCIVTYSTQPGMIEDVLRGTLSNCDINRMIIRGVTKDWLPNSATTSSGRNSCNFLGKEEHLIRVLTDLYNQRQLIIQSHEVLLVDDDIENVRLAQEFGHVAFKVEDNVELSDIESFVKSLPDARLSTDLSDEIGLLAPHSSVGTAGIGSDSVHGEADEKSSEHKMADDEPASSVLSQ